MRRAFRSIGRGAFNDKRHNNAPVLLTRAQRYELIGHTEGDNFERPWLYQLPVLVDMYPGHSYQTQIRCRLFLKDQLLRSIQKERVQLSFTGQAV